MAPVLLLNDEVNKPFPLSFIEGLLVHILQLSFVNILFTIIPDNKMLCLGNGNGTLPKKEAEKERFLDIHIYLTSALSKKDFRAVGLQVTLISSPSQVTTHYTISYHSLLL